jgi:pyruvate dehydrogenase E2 component (dihydrolipoamide acetyltransferase)
MDVLMPQLGETVAEGKITEWFKKPGEKVQPGENLFMIETDKVSMEIQAIAGGILSEIKVPAGDTVSVGTVVAVISDGSGAAASVPARASAPALPAPAKDLSTSGLAAPVAVPRVRIDTGPVVLDPFFEVRTPGKNFGPARIGGIAISPLARRLGAEAGIELSRVSGSGPHGRIVARDVEVAGTRARAALATSAASGAAGIMALYRDTPFEEVPLDGMRKTIAVRLVQAKQTIPHFYLSLDLEIGELLKLREQVNATAPRDQEGNPAFRLSLNDYIVKAWGWALQSVPNANAVWAEDRILRFQHSDIAVAVAIEGGLITPIIRKAETKTVKAISAEMKDLAARARSRRLKPNEYQGGSTSISNLGMYGVREFSAIINPPQTTILAIGAVRRAPIEKGNGVVFVSQMTVTLSCDHRVVDGALGAQLLAAFRGFIEKPMTMLV